MSLPSPSRPDADSPNSLPPSLASALKLSQIPALDGFRALAAFLVVALHAGVEWMPGGMGVLGFFVLSGFLITWLLMKEWDRTGTVGLVQFYARRSLRIFPAAYAYWFLIVVVLGVGLGKRVVWPQAISSFFYVTNYYQAFQGDPNTGLSHTWSLAVEEQFYLLWPAFFLFLSRRQKLHFAPLAWVIGLFWVYRLVLVLGLNVSQGYIYEAFDTRADHMLIGCLLAVTLRKGHFPRFWAAVCSSSWLALLPVAGLAVSAALQFHCGTFYRDTVGFLVEPVLVAILLPQWMAFHESRLWSWLNWGWLRYLGKISYSIYLYQQLVIHPVQKATSQLPFPVQLAACWLVVVAVGSASYWLVERPFLNWRERFRKA